MPDPFATALAVLFRAAGSVAAVFTPVEGQPIALRVIRGQATATLEHDLLVDTNTVQIQASDLAARPGQGDELAIGAEIFVIQGGARLDLEGLTWTCYLEPA